MEGLTVLSGAEERGGGGGGVSLLAYAVPIFVYYSLRTVESPCIHWYAALLKSQPVCTPALWSSAPDSALWGNTGGYSLAGLGLDL